MKKALLVLFLLLVVCVVLAGCEKKEEAPPPPPPPPEPSADEIAAKVRPALDPLKSPPIADEAIKPMLDKLTEFSKTYSTAVPTKLNGPDGVAKIAQEITEIIDGAKDVKRWKLVLAGISAYEAVRPSDTKWSRLKELATLQNGKPKVALRGFFTDQASGGQIYAFLEVTDPETQVTEQWRAREGEEAHKLRFVRIIGNQEGVTLEYLPIKGELFDVKR